MNIVKELNGHSGCKIYLIKNKNSDNLYVRKISGDKSYNNRLRRQFIKQREIEKYGKVKIPKLLNKGFIEDLFFFDMEFIESISLAAYMETASYEEIIIFVDKLFNSLCIENGIINENSNKIFQNKIEGILHRSTNLTNSAKKAITKLQSFDFSNVPESDCCGDLTLENILLKVNKEVYVIDVLDSFYNSWMMDVAKLLQDLEVYWSYRNDDNLELNSNLKVRLQEFKNLLVGRLLELEKGEEYLRSIYYILLSHIVRIYPYTSDEKTMNFLDNAVKNVLTIIEKMENDDE